MLPLFFVPEIPAENFLMVEGDEAHHAIKVSRIEIGEEINLADGYGNWARCRVDSFDKRSMVVTISERGTVTNLKPELVVVQALVKSDRSKEAVDLLTVAGADRIIPWQSERCISQWKEVMGAKWLNSAIAAAKQSRRFILPAIEEPIRTADIGKRFGTHSLLLICHEGAEDHLSEILSRQAENLREVVIVIGPEGGLSQNEVNIFLAAGGYPVRMGSTVLRSPHAGFAALSAVQAILGRW